MLIKHNHKRLNFPLNDVFKAKNGFVWCDTLSLVHNELKKIQRKKITEGKEPFLIPIKETELNYRNIIIDYKYKEFDFEIIQVRGKKSKYFLFNRLVIINEPEKIIKPQEDYGDITEETHTYTYILPYKRSVRKEVDDKEDKIKLFLKNGFKIVEYVEDKEYFSPYGDDNQIEKKELKQALSQSGDWKQLENKINTNIEWNQIAELVNTDDSLIKRWLFNYVYEFHQPHLINNDFYIKLEGWNKISNLRNHFVFPAILGKSITDSFKSNLDDKGDEYTKELKKTLLNNKLIYFNDKGHLCNEKHQKLIWNLPIINKIPFEYNKRYKNKFQTEINDFINIYNNGFSKGEKELRTLAFKTAFGKMFSFWTNEVGNIFIFTKRAGSGKTFIYQRLMELMEGVVGVVNTANLTKESKELAPQLKNKWVYIGNEINRINKESVMLLKELTEKENINLNVKYANPVSVIHGTNFIFTSNKKGEVVGFDEGIRRRAIYFEFREPISQETIKQKDKWITLFQNKEFKYEFWITCLNAFIDNDCRVFETEEMLKYKRMVNMSAVERLVDYLLENPHSNFNMVADGDNLTLLKQLTDGTWSKNFPMFNNLLQGLGYRPMSYTKFEDNLEQVDWNIVIKKINKLEGVKVIEWD